VAVLRVVLQMVLAIVLTVGLQLALRARLPPERRARGWNAATWGAAVYAFGPASMLGFFWVTRRPGKAGAAAALALGLAATAALLGLMAGVDLALDPVLGPGTWR
jgi:hypothetical protein